MGALERWDEPGSGCIVRARPPRTVGGLDFLLEEAFELVNYQRIEFVRCQQMRPFGPQGRRTSAHRSDDEVRDQQQGGGHND